MNDLGYIVTEPVSWEDALEVDEEFVEGSDVLLRLPGISKGADREERFARELGIPIVYTIEDLEKHRDAVNDAVRSVTKETDCLFKVV